MSRQLALGGQPVLVARWAEALSVVQQHPHFNRLLLVEAHLDEPALALLVRALVLRGCALVVLLGHDAENVRHAVDAVCETQGQLLATSWHDPGKEPEAALDAFFLFSTWVGGAPGLSLLVTEDEGLDSILDAARKLHLRNRTR
ncbi:MAG: hypothetical protein ACLQDQ_03130 [Myxococcaceae bacterium]